MTFRDGAPLDLVFDADDTLWDNNIHFLEAFDAFVGAVASVASNVPRGHVKAAVRAAELDVIKTHGYGRRPYIVALRQAAARLVPDGHRERLFEQVEVIGRTLVSRDCKLLPGVKETVAELASRNRLVLFTKGQPSEQQVKLKRSGLAPFFGRVETPREKDVGAYRRLLERARLQPARTFMIGNSPRSDVNPSLGAGFRAAIYIPHPNTWELEHEEIDLADARIIELAAFRNLRELF